MGRSAGENVQILAHDRREADENRARHDRVADRHLVEERQIAEHDEIRAWAQEIVDVVRQHLG